MFEMFETDIDAVLLVGRGLLFTLLNFLILFQAITHKNSTDKQYVFKAN